MVWAMTSWMTFVVKATQMNKTFERLKIQANIRRLIDEYGLDTALELYQQAIEKEMRYVDYQITLKHSNSTES